MKHHLCNDIKGGFSVNACLLWVSFLHPHTRYFEWGSGFTTRTSDKLARQVVSIEGSHEWYMHMKKYSFSAHMQLRYVDIGKTEAFSWPVNQSFGRRYIHAIEEYGPWQDVVLVDGRFRVACALAAFRHLAPGGKLLVHDFGRKEYHKLLEFYTNEQEVDSLAVLSPKPNVSHERLRERMEAVSYTAA